MTKRITSEDWGQMAAYWLDCVYIRRRRWKAKRTERLRRYYMRAARAFDKCFRMCKLRETQEVIRDPHSN